MARKRGHTYEYPRPAVTVDVVLFTVAGALNELRLEVLLVQRELPPDKGKWALPGGFVREDEALEAAALRELQEETGVDRVVLEQVGAVGTPGRDPRGHTITIVYVGLVAPGRHRLQAGGDAGGVGWYPLGEATPLPSLAFDHAALLQLALDHLRRRIGEAPLVFDLLPEAFTVSELQALVEAILGRTLDRRNFRRKVQDLQLLAPAEGQRSLGGRGHRPAQLFRFVPEAFAEYRRRQRQLPF